DHRAAAAHVAETLDVLCQRAERRLVAFGLGAVKGAGTHPAVVLLGRPPQPDLARPGADDNRRPAQSRRPRLHVRVADLLPIAQAADEFQVVIEEAEAVFEVFGPAEGGIAADAGTGADANREPALRQGLQSEKALCQLNRVTERDLVDRGAHLDVV